MSLAALAIIIAVFSAVFILVGVATRRPGIQTVYDFFLANQSIHHAFIANLLFSTSFSLNGMLYQIYLGYKIGLWALIPQAAWALSFWLLGRFSTTLISTNGLHKFIGAKYGVGAQVLAAICSILGFALLLGWEFSVARSAITGIAPPESPASLLEVLVLAIFAVSVLYTLSGGIRSNAIANIIQNGIKVVAFLIIIVVLIAAAFQANESDKVVWVPPFSKAVAELTILGFVTNIAFSLAWQFVDTSTWQTTVATRRDEGPEGIRKSLGGAAWLVFIAPGIFGTVIGVGLSGAEGLTSDNVLPILIRWLGPVSVGLLAGAVIATVMSTVDGLILASGYALITDLIFRRTVERYNLLRETPPGGSAKDEFLSVNTRVMAVTRIAIIVIAISGTYAITTLLYSLKMTLFDVLYVLIISQLCLFGPVIFALFRVTLHWWAGISGIVFGLVVGFGAVVRGLVWNQPDFITAAGTLALIASVVGTLLGIRLRRKAIERAS